MFLLQHYFGMKHTIYFHNTNFLIQCVLVKDCKEWQWPFQWVIVATQQFLASKRSSIFVKYCTFKHTVYFLYKHQDIYTDACDARWTVTYFKAAGRVGRKPDRRVRTYKTWRKTETDEDSELKKAICPRDEGLMQI